MFEHLQSVTSKVGRFCYVLPQTKYVQHRRKFFCITICHIIYVILSQYLCHIITVFSLPFFFSAFARPSPLPLMSTLCSVIVLRVQSGLFILRVLFNPFFVVWCSGSAAFYFTIFGINIVYL